MQISPPKSNRLQSRLKLGSFLLGSFLGVRGESSDFPGPFVDRWSIPSLDIKGSRAMLGSNLCNVRIMGAHNETGKKRGRDPGPVFEEGHGRVATMAPYH